MDHTTIQPHVECLNDELFASNKHLTSKGIIFDSMFECGNLAKVYMASENEFDLYINKDTNSEFYSQWFYYSVENASKGQEIRFNILNYSKPTNLFKYGLTPVVFSMHDFHDQRIGWQHSVYDITFKKTNIDFMNETQKHGFYSTVGKGSEGDETKYFYTLSFSYTFKSHGDKVYFALLKPYSFSRIYSFICELETKLRESDRLYKKERTGNTRTRVKKAKKKKKLVIQNLFKFQTKYFTYTRDLLCFTNLGLPIDVITITGEHKRCKQVILITSRVHASEIPSSLKLEQILKTLTSNSPYAIDLLNHFTIIIIPMLNPDGVIMGNTRTSFEGYDLNRCWSDPDKSIHVPIYSLKRLIKLLYKANREIYLFCDLHGHGKLPNSFIYACNRSSDGDFSSWTKIRLLPKILSKHSPFFSYSNCQFKVEAGKKDTGRIVLWKEFNVMNSFTFETSIFGYYNGETYVKFTEENIGSLGEAFIKSLYEYSKIIREMGKDAMISKAYNFLFEQAEKNIAKDELFPVIENKEKKKEVIHLKASSIIPNKIPKEIKIPQAIDNKGSFLEDELLEAVINISSTQSTNYKQNALSNNNKAYRKPMIKSKVMNFGGNLAILKPFKEISTCCTRHGSCLESRDYSTYEYLSMQAEHKPNSNDQGVKVLSILPDDCAEPPSIKIKKDYLSKLSPHISMKLNRLANNNGKMFSTGVSERSKNILKIRDLHHQIMQKHGTAAHPSFLSDEVKLYEPPKSRGCSTISQQSMNINRKHNFRASQDTQYTDGYRMRGTSLRSLQ